jgi:hypothetical protein
LNQGPDERLIVHARRVATFRYSWPCQKVNFDMAPRLASWASVSA